MSEARLVLLVFVMSIIVTGFGVVADATPPAPDPATFSEIPNLVLDLDNECHMTATPGTDSHTPVLYYFDETTGNRGGTDSGWIAENTYIDMGLMDSTTYTYRVKMKDALGNETAWSGSSSVAVPEHTYLPNRGGPTNLFYDETTDPNAFAATSKHIRIVWGPTAPATWDYGAGVLTWDQVIAGNLDMFEDCWDRYMVDIGFHEPTQSTIPAQRDGNRYKVNIIVGLTGLARHGGGGCWLGYEGGIGFGYVICDPVYMRYSPPSGATPHEFAHVLQVHGLGKAQFQGSSGFWWEAHANWMMLQFLNEYPTVGLINQQSNYYQPHGRHYYDCWQIFEHLMETPEYGYQFVNSLWNEGLDSEDLMQAMVRLDPNPATPIADEWGMRTMKSVNWDFDRHDIFITQDTSDEKFRFGRILLQPMPGNTGWYRVPWTMAPQQFGYNLCPLTPVGKTGGGHVVEVDFHGYVNPARGTDWRAGLVVIDDAGNSRFSTQWNDGINSVTLAANENLVYLTVTATPTNIMRIVPETPYRNLEKETFPYRVHLTGAAPVALWPPAPSGGGHAHSNGGGFVANTATVDASAYVGPDAQVLNSAHVHGNARIEGHAVVQNNATVQGNAIVSDYAWVKDNPTIQDYAKVRGFTTITGDAVMSDRSKALDYAQVLGCNLDDDAVMKGRAALWGAASGNAIIDGDYANGLTHTKGTWFHWFVNNQQMADSAEDQNGIYMNFEFENDHPYLAWDTYGVPHGYLENGPTAVTDDDTDRNQVLELDGVDQYVELPKDVADMRDIAIIAYVKWDGGAANQRILEFYGDATHYLYITPSNGNGKAAVVIRNGGSETALEGEAPLPVGVWRRVLFMLDGDDAYLTMEGQEVVTATITTNPDDLRATGCFLGRGMSGGYFGGRLDSVTIYSKSLVDPNPPTPNPAQFSVEPFPVSTSSIRMTAVEGTDESGYVEYYFTETSGHSGGDDSGWQAGPVYVDDGLTAGLTYTYTVKMRDSTGNETAASAPVSVLVPTSIAPLIDRSSLGNVELKAGEAYIGPIPVLLVTPDPAATWELDAASLALGMTIDPNTGQVTWGGTSTVGYYPVTITVGNTAGEDSVTFGISVLEVAGELLVAINSSELSPGQLTSWPNHGTLGGNFNYVSGTQATVENTPSLGGMAVVTSMSDVAYELRDGSGSRIGTTSDLVGATAWTMETWLKRKGMDGESVYAGWGSRGGPDAGSVSQFSYTDGRCYIGWGRDFDWGTRPTSNQYHHVAFTYDPAIPAIRVYVDGTPNTTYNGEFNNVALGMPISLFNVSTGGGTGWHNQCMLGSIAKLRIHSDALSEAQVLANYNAEEPAFEPVPAPELQIVYPMNNVVNIGDVAVGNGPASPYEVVYVNAGDDTMHPTSVVLTGEFTMEPAAADLGDVAPGETRTITVLFDPETAGEQEGVLTIQSDGGNAGVTFFGNVERWYVNATGGDDGHDGRTLGTAFATIGRAVGGASRGDAIEVAPGSYGRWDMFSNDYVLRFVAPLGGAVITGYPIHVGSAAGQNATMIFEGFSFDSGPTGGGYHGAIHLYDNGTKDMTFKDCAFQARSTAGIAGSIGVMQASRLRLTIDGCSFTAEGAKDGVNIGGIATPPSYAPNLITIANSTFENCRRALESFSPNAMVTMTDSVVTNGADRAVNASGGDNEYVFRGNEYIEGPSQGSDRMLELSSGGIGRGSIIFEANYVYGTKGQGITLRDTDLVSVINNIVEYGGAGQAIDTWQITAEGSVFYNNTVIRVGTQGGIGIQCRGGKAVNNVALGFNSPIDSAAGSSSNNLTNATSQGNPNFTFQAGAAWAIPSTRKGPLAYVPVTLSSLIDAGADAGVGEDYQGTHRPQGTLPDVGAFEFVPEGSENPPTPNPATFATAPHAISSSAIAMLATAGSDPNGPVEYYFTETSGNPGGSDSGWQTDPSYADDGLEAITEYAYTVKMRDSLHNEGAASAPASATTRTERTLSGVDEGTWTSY